MNASTETHRVWRVGADIDTDALAPGAYMKFGIDEIARHCLQRQRPDFAANVNPGDVIVAGPNFGIGSSREQAPAALVQLGVRAVIAPAFSGLFFRNAFNVGLVLLTCAQAETMEEGERIAIDPLRGRITRASGVTLVCDPLPAFLLDMAEAGGLFKLLQQRYSVKEPSSHDTR
ncbi:LeuD/DmdB family oxidoreductase small subunit [Caballeronia concitans]|uniref:3-isopropylmalate dehydratase, small subunit n=1 Tax=Caballeronia concitans TaxID=1777133 RepID=A0A658QTZ6_9BURK|nr:3-isopropylmalate dehydratase [Caballeronia concitans]KIG10103.1 3-isopropylmalate dehydratase, small subunit [Burkholderia sp. MR1]SAL21116.1 3-isopropylmalate dehydratase, small subunit [Caballeronia concitans]